MKKSFSLIEVLIAVMLISVVILTMLKTNQNNLSFLNKFESSSANNGYLNLAFFGMDTVSQSCKDESFYLDEVADFKDDDIRIQLKEVKVTSKCEKPEEKKMDAENHQLTIVSTKQNINIENTKNKDFYRFRLEYK